MFKFISVNIILISLLIYYKYSFYFEDKGKAANGFTNIYVS